MISVSHHCFWARNPRFGISYLLRDVIIIGDGSDITTWSAVESSVGLVCASAPPLKPLYRLLSCRTPSTDKGYSNINATRAHPYCNQHPHDKLPGTQRCGVHMTRESGTDIESTADLVAPMPVSQSYAMTVATVRAK
jgi:hypothetical protein